AIYPLSLHDALPISRTRRSRAFVAAGCATARCAGRRRSSLYHREVEGQGHPRYRAAEFLGDAAAIVVTSTAAQQLVGAHGGRNRSEEHTSELQSRSE